MTGRDARPPGDGTADLEFDRAYQLSELGRYADAARSALRGLALEPDSVFGLNLLAFVQCQLGDLASARETSERALAVDPDDAWAHYTRGIVLWTDGDGRAALACFDRALELWPGSDYLHAIKAELLGAVGRPHEGLEEIDVALAMDPDSVEHRLKKIDLLRDLHREDTADEIVAETLRLAPAAPAVHRRAADTALRQERPDEAVRWFRSALAADPGDDGARDGLIEALEEGAGRRFFRYADRILVAGVAAAVAWWILVDWRGAPVIVLLALAGPALFRDLSIIRHPLGRAALPLGEKVLAVSAITFGGLALVGLGGQLTTWGSGLGAPMLAATVIAFMFAIVRVNLARWVDSARTQAALAWTLTLLAILVTAAAVALGAGAWR